MPSVPILVMPRALDGRSPALIPAARGRIYQNITLDDFVKSLLKRHPGESRGPELIEMVGFRLSPE
jgi:hypothetical protein